MRLNYTSQELDAARQYLKRYEITRPDVVLLAMIASPARRIESELLRSLRLSLNKKFPVLTNLTVATEAALWFSLFVESRGPNSITLLPEYSKLLRDKLKMEEDLLEAAYKIIQECHKSIPPVIRWEEELVYLSLTNSIPEKECRQRIEQHVWTVVKAISTGERPGLEESLVEMWTRLPNIATQSATLTKLRNFSLVKSRQADSSTSIQRNFSQYLNLDFTNIPSVVISIQMEHNHYQIRFLSNEDAFGIQVPNIVPITIDVLTSDSSNEISETYIISEGGIIKIPVQSKPVYIRTFEGKIYSLDPKVFEKQHEHISSKSLITNHNLPARTYGSKLIGREEYIKKVLKGIQEGPVVTIEGFSGIGKTSVALEIAYVFLNRSEFKSPLDLQFNYIVWISAKNKEQRQWLNDVLNKIAEVLEHPSIAQISAENLSTKRNEVEKLLRQPNHKLFLIIDNFETVEDPDLEEWLLLLNEPNKVLITSQKQGHESWRVVNLERLSDDEAKALIRKYAEAKDLNRLLAVTDEKLLNLVEITGGNPLALRLAIGQISGGKLTLDQVVNNLKENNPTASIDMVFNKIHETSWISIGAKAQQLLLVTPLFIGSDSIDKKALQATSGLSEDEYEIATQTLLTWKLLEPNFDDINRLVIHPMTRRFVKSKLFQHKEFESKARKLWYNYYLQFITAHVKRKKPPVEYWNALVDDKMEKIDSEWTNIYEVLKWSASEVSGDNDRLLLKLIFLLVHYMDSRFYNLERIRYVELAIGAASRLESKYQEALLRIDALGWTYVEENKYNEAYSQIMHGIELAKEVKGTSIEKNELMALGYAWVARVKIEQNKSKLLDEAVKFIGLALAFKDYTQPWIHFRILMAAGDIFLKQNKNKEALEKFISAKEQMTHYGGEGHYYQINPRIGLANLALGKFSEAEVIFNDLSNQKKISIGKLYGDYGLALLKFKKGDSSDIDIQEANILLDNVKEELSKRTSSNLLLKLIEEFEKTLKR